MSAASGQWDDLATRLISAAALGGIGMGAVWLGGIWFHIFVCLVCGIMIWELARMLGGEGEALLLAGVSGGLLMIAAEVPPGFALPLVVGPALFGLGRLEKNRTIYAIYAVMILLAGYGLMILRDDFGFTWMLWLVCVVMVADVAGYFAGRAIGGPKFWPKVSPKKTWSGTVAGWVGAALVAWVFIAQTGVGIELIGISIALAMAGQLGDIAESAVKRKCAVKDSSSLIPGHGGLFDRFDAMLGASVFLLLVEQLVDFPPPPIL
ncbi:MAG: phosphatidate cytidylyltransferase [Pseudomonadota bacterium]